jgi:hypothetical protein
MEFFIQYKYQWMMIVLHRKKCSRVKKIVPNLEEDERSCTQEKFGVVVHASMVEVEVPFSTEPRVLPGRSK